MSNLAEVSKFKHMTEIEHVLKKPGIYLGGIEPIDEVVWIVDNEEGNKIKQKNVRFIPAFGKMVDEILVNAADHFKRMKEAVSKNEVNALPVTYISFEIKDDGTIIIENNGNGVPVVQHPEYKVMLPELIFATLRSSSNYDEDEKKIVGGTNGLGAKLVLIWSEYVRIETVDHKNGLKYVQEFKNNLSEVCKAKVTSCKSKPYTRFEFKPDYKRFGFDGLTPDLIALLKRRVYDIAAITDKSLQVKINSVPVPVKHFKHYIDMYIGDKSPRMHEEPHPRWEIAVGLSPTGEFIQISFVNGIFTSKGGKHVDYILSQVTRKMIDYIEKKKKVRVNPNSIKEQLILFVRCDIENPTFDSQTKDCMTTPSSKFGSSCEISEKCIEGIAKMGVMTAACAITEFKENKVAKKTDGQKTKSIRGISKLTDANWAGTDKSSQCTIIFCEGDSAKAGVLSGLSPSDRNTCGVYALKGKMFNVRGEPNKKVAENKEITEIKKILGLESGKKYTQDDVHKHLRYGKVLFMTDQDLDGSHIKALGVNLFQCEWPSLTEIPGFIGFMNTPILKARKGKAELLFYNDGEYEEWKKTNDTKGWSIKYYKGLGTSTGKEFREYFENKKIVDFQHKGKESEDAIDMVFNKKRADDRKDWLEDYNRESYLDTSNTTVSYDDFINKELIHFSKYDCDRSIPNLMDGLKTSQRKILYAAFKKGLTTEIKVAQFSGYVSEHSCYHHGEASLNGAIVGMAQNFVGSNNINLLVPSGQFGTRLKGGDDSASERYIFTLLNKVTRSIFQTTDDNVLKYLTDDGTPVEPIFYAPIIPIILVNGSKGIGTGFSTDIMCYNPLDIIDYLNGKLSVEGVVSQQNPILPYYEGFKGTITSLTDHKYLIRGKYDKVDSDKVHVTELPIGFWTDDFKELLEALIDPGQDKAGKKIVPIIKDYCDMSKDTNVDFTITFAKGRLAELEASSDDNGCNGVDKLLKLYTTNTNTNMHLFDANDKLKKYTTVTEIIDDYFVTRLELYKTRKEYMICALEKELLLLSNKARYIQENLDGTIDLRKKTKAVVTEMLNGKKYDIMDDDTEFKYLTKMTMDSVTEENIQKLFGEREKKNMELSVVKSTTVNQMWSNELTLLRTEYLEYKEQRQRLMDGTESKKKVVSKGVVKKQLKIVN
jgi:DNA topoisomerase-2